MNIPKVRFSKYKNEWKKIKLDELYVFKNGLNGDRNIYGTGVELISVSDILNNDYITKNVIKGKVNISNKVLNDNSVEYGDVLFQRSSETFLEIGSSNVYLDSEPVTFSGFVIRGKKRNSNNNNPLFINYELKSPSSRKKIILSGAGSQHFNIGQEELKKISIYIPEIAEQNDISKTMELLSKKIELQKNKIDLLKALKKGIIERELSKDYPKESLKNILKERKLYSEKGQEYPHVTLSKDGIYDKCDRYNRDFLVKSDDKKYKITKLNDLCYNPANLKFGVICLNEYGNAIFSPIYVTFEVDKKVNPKYIKYYTMRNNFIYAVRKYEQGTVYERMAVSPEDFLRFDIKLPSRDIQDEIVNRIEIIDKKIKLEDNVFIELNNIKKGLIQSIFV